MVAVLFIGFAAVFAARHIGGFYARVEEEDEQAAREELEQERKKQGEVEEE